LRVTSLDRYIFRQVATPFAFAAVGATAIVWATQSLQRLDLLVEHGQGLLAFGQLTLLLIPSLVAAILPFALFAATLFALQRMHADSEIAVMFGSGVGRFRLARPILLLALGCAAATSYVSLDLMPRSYRVLKREIADIRADFATSVLRSGEFMTVADGFVVYVEEARPGGKISGLLIHDFRPGMRATTYMAQRGLLEEGKQGPVLYLANGNLQRVDADNGAIEIIEFDQTAIELSSIKPKQAYSPLEMTERYLGELLRPDMTQPWERENRARLVAEGHNRLASPLYAFAYALIAIYAMLAGGYNRRGYFVRVISACAAVGALRVAGFVLQGEAAENERFWLVWAAPIFAICVSVALIGGVMRVFRRPPPAAEGV
jgi:lipopolysaccharide export system permease protein